MPQPAKERASECALLWDQAQRGSRFIANLQPERGNEDSSTCPPELSDLPVCNRTSTLNRWAMQCIVGELKLCRYFDKIPPVMGEMLVTYRTYAQVTHDYCLV